MNVDVTRHPEFPFRHGQGDLLEARAAAFLDGPPAEHLGGETLREFLYLAHAFAFLEKLVQGEVLCELPAHAGTILSGPSNDPEDQGERLAEAEEDLLEWEAGSVDLLAGALDTLGVKVFLQSEEAEGPEFSDEAAAARAADEAARTAEAASAAAAARPVDLFGAFCFDAGVGPAFLAGAIEGTPEADFILAHELGHLVADIDPYRSRFCRWDGRTFHNHSDRPEERRADRFARALLMPASMLLRALHDLGPAAGDQDAERLVILATLFGVPPALVARRLADLGVRLPDAIVPPAALGVETVSSTERPPRRPLPLPERYVNLALAAYGGRALSLEVLAQFLRTSEEEAQRVADWAGVRPAVPSAFDGED